METKKQMTNAEKLLSDGLQEQALQLGRKDAKAIADETGITARMVRTYLKGEVPDIDTGAKVIKAARALIIKRENSIKKLVA